MMARRDELGAALSEAGRITGAGSERSLAKVSGELWRGWWCRCLRP